MELLTGSLALDGGLCQAVNISSVLDMRTRDEVLLCFIVIAFIHLRFDGFLDFKEAVAVSFIRIIYSLLVLFVDLVDDATVIGECCLDLLSEEGVCELWSVKRACLV